MLKEEEEPHQMSKERRARPLPQTNCKREPHTSRSKQIRRKKSPAHSPENCKSGPEKKKRKRTTRRSPVLSQKSIKEEKWLGKRSTPAGKMKDINGFFQRHTCSNRSRDKNTVGKSSRGNDQQTIVVDDRNTDAPPRRRWHDLAVFPGSLVTKVQSNEKQHLL